MSVSKTAFHNPFEALGALRGALPPGKELPSGADSMPGNGSGTMAGDGAPGASGLRRGDGKSSPPARAVLRLQRKGRAGKEVTVVEKLGLEISEAKGWLRDLKRELACGGMMEDDVLVFQGDHRERLGVLLRARGLRKLSMG